MQAVNGDMGENIPRLSMSGPLKDTLLNLHFKKMTCLKKSLWMSKTKFLFQIIKEI